MVPSTHSEPRHERDEATLAPRRREAHGAAASAAPQAGPGSCSRARPARAGVPPAPSSQRRARAEESGALPVAAPVRVVPERASREPDPEQAAADRADAVGPAHAVPLLLQRAEVAKRLLVLGVEAVEVLGGFLTRPLHGVRKFA